MAAQYQHLYDEYVRQKGVKPQEIAHLHAFAKLNGQKIRFSEAKALISMNEGNIKSVSSPKSSSGVTTTDNIRPSKTIQSKLQNKVQSLQEENEELRRQIAILKKSEGPRHSAAFWDKVKVKVRNDDNDAIKELVASGQMTINDTNSTKQTLATYAASRGNYEVETNNIKIIYVCND